MSSEATAQVLDTAIDRDGLSTVTSTKTTSNPRLGSIYNPLTLAAATPVWFHPFQDGQYLALLSNHWEQATIGTGGPQTYSAHTEVTTPTWVTIDPVSGAASKQLPLPTVLSGTRTLTGACSRGEYLFTVGALDTASFIQHYRVTPNGQLVTQAEEVLAPTEIGDDVVHWDHGIYIDGDYLVVIGADASSGGLYRRRKSWGRVAQDVATAPWQYKGVKGWFTDPDEAGPEQGILAGDSATYASKGDREWLCTHASGRADFYSSRRVEPSWKKSTFSVTADAVYLQPQLYYNPAVLDEGVTAGVPFVATTRDATSGKNALKVSWGVLAV